MRHSKHYFRAGFLIAGGLFAFLIVRALVIPKSFGEFGFYRGDNIAEQMAKPVNFGPKESCAECHGEVAQTHKKGMHQSVQCQNCHAPLSVHIKDGAFQELMPIDRSATLCLRCHEKLPSRPEKFPQINHEEHLGSKGLTLAPGICLTCHQPHDPLPGATPKQPTGATNE